MPKITMYGADWCADCRRAKSFFEENDVVYRYVDLVLEPEEMSEVLRRNRGRRNIPVIVFDDETHLTEPTNDELAAKLEI